MVQSTKKFSIYVKGTVHRDMDTLPITNDNKAGGGGSDRADVGNSRRDAVGSHSQAGLAGLYRQAGRHS